MEVIPSVDVPLDLVSVSFWGEGLETVALCYACSLIIRQFLMLLIVAMIGVDEILEFADLGLEVVCFFLDFVEVRLFSKL